MKIDLSNGGGIVLSMRDRLVSVLAAFFMLLLLPCLSQTTPPGYVLGPEDVVTVTVLRHPEFSGDFVIPNSNLLDVPVVGNVDVTGMTAQELSRVLTQKFKKRLLKPEVTVVLKLPRIQRIYVLGNVERPGVLDLKPNWKAAEAISAAGGVVPNLQSADVQVRLERNGTVLATRPLSDALSDTSDAYKLQPGDVLRVDAIPLESVYVSGSVRNPGLVMVRSDLRTVLSVIAQAGGVNADAAISSIKLIHPDGKQETVDLTPFLQRAPTSPGTAAPLLVTSQSIPVPMVNSGDMVVVPQSQDRIAVLGFVGRPGYYPIPDGQRLDLADAVALASGASDSVNNRARLNKIGLIRRKDGKDVRMVYDLGKYFKTGDTTQDPPVYAGDIIYVPESRRVETATVLGGLTVAAIFFNLFRI